MKTTEILARLVGEGWEQEQEQRRKTVRLCWILAFGSQTGERIPTYCPGESLGWWAKSTMVMKEMEGKLSRYRGPEEGGQGAYEYTQDI